MEKRARTLLWGAGLVCGVAAVGIGGFQGPIVVNVTSPNNDVDAFRRLAVVDIDGNGTHDVLIGGEEGVTLLRNLGGTTFDADDPPLFPVSLSTFVAPIDLDGDDQLDFVATGYPTTVFRDDDAGGWTAEPLAPIDEQDPDALDAIWRASGGFNLVVGDFDGRLGPDFAFPVGFGLGVAVYLNDGTGHFAPGGSFTTGGNDAPPPTWLEVADMDGNGTLDLVAANYTLSRMYTAFNDGNANFTSRGSIETGRSPNQFAVGDLDGDGDIDAVTGNRMPTLDSQYSMTVALNDGSGIFRETRTLESELVIDVRMVDLDDDGDNDLVSTHTGGGVTFRRNSGDGTFLPAVNRSSGLSGNAYYADFADFDGNGLPDVAMTALGSMTLSILLASDTAPPTQIQVVPNVLSSMGPHDLAVTGTGFSSFVDLDLGENLDVTALTVDSGTSLRSSVSVSAPTGAGLRDVVVTNADGAQGVGTIELRSIDVSVARGKIKDTARAARDKAQVTGVATYNGLATTTAFDPAAASLTLRIADGSGDVYVTRIPRDDAGWKTTRAGALKWKTPRTAVPKIKLVLDPRTGAFRFTARKLDLPRSAAADVRVEIETRTDTGFDRGVDDSAWEQRGTGRLRR